MSYQSPMRDIQFVLHELLQVPAMLEACGQPELDAETIDQVLAAAGQFASEVIAPLNAPGDEHGCSMPSAGVVQTPPGFKKAYDEFTKNGWPGLACSPEFGGRAFLRSWPMRSMKSSAARTWRGRPIPACRTRRT